MVNTTYQIESRFNKKTLKLFYGLVGKSTSIFGFKSIREARNFLVIINNKINVEIKSTRPTMG